MTSLSYSLFVLAAIYCSIGYAQFETDDVDVSRLDKKVIDQALTYGISSVSRLTGVNWKLSSMIEHSLQADMIRTTVPVRVKRPRRVFDEQQQKWIIADHFETQMQQRRVPITIILHFTLELLSDLSDDHHHHHHRCEHSDQSHQTVCGEEHLSIPSSDTQTHQALKIARVTVQRDAHERWSMTQFQWTPATTTTTASNPSSDTVSASKDRLTWSEDHLRPLHDDPLLGTGNAAAATASAAAAASTINTTQQLQQELEQEQEERIIQHDKDDERRRRSHTPVTVMSANIWNYNHWQKRLPIMSSAIHKADPDIIGFQEVRNRLHDANAASQGTTNTVSKHQAEDLAQSLNKYQTDQGKVYQYVAAAAMSFQEGDSEYVQEGLAIFSRYPIKEHQRIRLSRDPTDGEDFHQRILLYARIEIPGWGRTSSDLHVLVTHLSLSEKARTRTLREIGDFAAKLQGPVVLLGDFNMEIKDANSVLETDFGFQDAWRRTHPEASEEKGWTFNSWEMKSRIDFVFVRNVSPIDIQVVGEEGVSFPPEQFLEPVGGVRDMKQTMFPSDHRFLLATLNTRGQ